MQHQQVFVVDDDPIVANLIELRLKKMGYEVSGVSGNGADALEKMRQSLHRCGHHGYKPPRDTGRYPDGKKNRDIV